MMRVPFASVVCFFAHMVKRLCPPILSIWPHRNACAAEQGLNAQIGEFLVYDRLLKNQDMFQASVRSEGGGQSASSLRIIICLVHHAAVQFCSF